MFVSLTYGDVALCHPMLGRIGPQQKSMLHLVVVRPLDICLVAHQVNENDGTLDSVIYAKFVLDT